MSNKSDYSETWMVLIIAIFFIFCIRSYQRNDEREHEYRMQKLQYLREYNQSNRLKGEDR
jgi:preprotein translocase subunit YajC